MPLLCKSTENLKLFYRIYYDIWKIEDAFYIRTAFFTKDEALAKFKDKFPSKEGKIICDIVIVN